MDTINERRSARALLEAQVHEPFIRLSNEARELGCVHLAVESSIPDPLSFYRKYVSTNRPCLIEGVADEWPAMQKWKDNQYLIDNMRDQSISVSCTPDGMADSVNQTIDRFCMPCDEQWPFEKFLNECTKHDSQSLDEQKQAEHDRANNQPSNQSNKHPKAVIYAQHQNSSLASEFSHLVDDIRPLTWASSAFGCEPEAVNLWIGNSDSVTSPHMDHYENIYTVVTGVKRFLLWPPQDCYFMNRRRVKQARWVRNPEFKQSIDQSNNQSTEQPEFILQPDDDMPNIPWPDVDARKEWFVHATQEEIDEMFKAVSEAEVEQTINQLNDQLSQQSLDQSNNQSSNQSISQTIKQSNELDYIPFNPIPDRLRHQHAPPLCVTLRAGQTLYLPSMWFHAVLQGEDEQGKTIAVNSWFDMTFDTKFAYFTFLSERIDEAYQHLEEIDEQCKKSDDEDDDEEESNE